MTKFVIAVMDRETGNLLYFVQEKNGYAFREYPDGHIEKANKQEQALIDR